MWHFMNLWFILFPISGALIGCLTGFLLCGIFARQISSVKKSAIAADIADFVSDKMISVDTITKKVAGPEQLLRLMPVIETHIDDFLRNRLKIAIPMIGMLIGDRTIAQ